MKRIRFAAVLAIALLALSFGRASAFSVTMTPPGGTVGTPQVFCTASAKNVGTSAIWTITDYRCAEGLLLNGWSMVGGSKSSFSGGNTVAAALSNAAANYFPMMGIGLASTTETDVSLPVPMAGFLSNLYCHASAAPGASKSYAYVVRDNAGSPTAGLTCTITGASGAGSTSCSDNQHVVTMAIGDLIDMVATPTGTPTANSSTCTVQVNY